jgi:alkanesulfonate monooxygenase SsuD/methylene tetrahydromethanopterin reductase-like flavin-dependent oxidoreductase (luciferase family)
VRGLATRDADLLFASPRTLEEAVEQNAAALRQVAAEGRDASRFRTVTPILPIVAPTRERAWAVYDALVALVPLPDEQAGESLTLPANRSTRALAGVLGVPLAGADLDAPVAARTAARFGSLGAHLVEAVRARSGRTVGGARPTTLRHLLVAHAVPAPVVVGSARDIADHLETWYRAAAVDGFTVLSAFGGGGDGSLEAFFDLVVPELQRRGLFRVGYAGHTLRDHLDLPAVPNSHLRVRLQPL